MKSNGHSNLCLYMNFCYLNLCTRYVSLHTYQILTRSAVHVPTQCGFAYRSHAVLLVPSCLGRWSPYTALTARLGFADCLCL